MTYAQEVYREYPQAVWKCDRLGWYIMIDGVILATGRKLEKAWKNAATNIKLQKKKGSKARP
jgi:hypothetical protein